MASIIKVDQLSEKTQGSGITLSHSLKNSSGSEIISSSGLIESPTFVGMIASFAMSSAPTGWIVCNGAPYAIADYGDLYTAIGTTWGALTDENGGAGSTHFRVPDLRGEFLRGFDNGTGNDPDASSRTGGDAVGSSQSYEIQSHNHEVRVAAFHYGSGSAYRALRTANSPTDYGIENTGGNETRPRNKYVQYCIKY